MPNISYEITLNNTPYYDNLLQELIDVTLSKRRLYRKIKTIDEYYGKLGYEERELIKHLTEKENRILLELISLKGWPDNFNLPEIFRERDSEEDFDKYVVNY